ncbi:MAG: succinate dehydrogenase assembly factor 2 [Pseudohongiellaceae bacterium]
MISEVEMKRLYWHSRRGMLELDLILVPFVENRLATLDEKYHNLYRELLEQEDQDLYAWLVRRSEPPSGSLAEMVAKIIT